MVNPESGKGRGGSAAPRLATALRARGIQTAMLIGTDAEHGLALARQAVADGVDALVAAGGDGTVNLALQAVAGTTTPLAIAALGTGNDNAMLLGLPIKDPNASAEVIANGTVRSIDVASVTAADGTGRWFLGVLSSGFDSLVTERANQMKWPKGEARYLVAVLGELRTFKPVRFSVDVDGQQFSDEGMLAAIGNGVSYGGGMNVCAGAKVDDGLLTMTWLHRVSTLDFLRTFPKVFKGTHLLHPEVTQHHGKRIRLDAPGQLAYADGERIGELPIDVEVHPGALRVLVPSDSSVGQPVADG